jgi:hydrogenase maturation protein HypF
VEVEGQSCNLELFLIRLEAEKPPRSFIQSLESSWLDAVGYKNFEIRPSAPGGSKSALILPDIATCPDCLHEIFDPSNRRYRYPFTNCTHCGPRFSIIRGLPYDRANTSMNQFAMCPLCQAEYEDPTDRRFHAQPNACPRCGPQLELWARNGEVIARGEQALARVAAAIREGRSVAVKGLGGFHLMVDSSNDQSLRRLRELKHREEKPFALMFPTLAAVRDVCELSPLEERLLRSSEAPIVLLRRRGDPANSVPSSAAISHSVAPGNPYLGAMLPYTPLHHLLLSMLGSPVVATSGNLSDEPICTDEHEALERLGHIADVFLVHNRPIVRHIDDSVARIVLGRELVLRRARGYAPLPVAIAGAPPQIPRVLAVGAHLKNAIALSIGGEAFISQHIGDLETAPAFNAFQQVINDFENLYNVQPAVIVADWHPDYLSTRFALERASEQSGTSRNPTLLQVQHHVAHVLSCMTENQAPPPILGVSWDGTGFGLDGTVWGGEFFLVTETECERVAHLRQFRLPGGDKAVREPRRAALGLLFALFGENVFWKSELHVLRAFTAKELGPLRTMLLRGFNSPLTSSVGRLFDAVAALAGPRQKVRFEGQAAMELEFALEKITGSEAYEFAITSPDSALHIRNPVVASAIQPAPASQTESPNPSRGLAPLVLDWAPVIQAIIVDLNRATPLSQISLRFHNALAEAVVVVAQRLRQERVVLTGGCFQNQYLTERTVQRLQSNGFHPYWHQRVPPNDGGIALGQVVAALRTNS